jgi:hypothetical protein
MVPDHTWFASKLLPKEIITFSELIQRCEPALLEILSNEVTIGNRISGVTQLDMEIEILLKHPFHHTYHGKFSREEFTELHNNSISYRSADGFRVTAPTR